MRYIFRRFLRKRFIVPLIGVIAASGGYVAHGHSAEISATSGNLVAARTLRVIDGDTAVFNIAGRKTTVRFIGVNTPETVKPNSPVECFGEQASAFTSSNLTDKSVYLELDPSQSKYDRYGRMLAYVWLGKTLYNLELIEEGYAYEATYAGPYRYQAEFKDAEKDARDHNRGLWNPRVCPQR